MQDTHGSDRRPQDLARTLIGMDGRSYSSYKQLVGTHDLGDCGLAVDHVQSDPYAPPSRMCVLVDAEDADLPQDLLETAGDRIAVGDFLTRRFAAELRAAGAERDIRIDAPGQQVLERSSVLLTPDRAEVRLEVALPAAGRRIKGRAAARILTEVLPQVARAALLHRGFDARTREALRAHVVLLRDQEHLRASLRDRGLIAFVGEGAILPRRSGDSDLPLESRLGAVPFTSPDSLRTEFALPSGGSVSGMGVPEGVTVIVGGGYHGKSTVLRALERGVYPHIAGDGREWVVTRADAVAIRAEDGRAVTGVDISPFISNLPTGTDTCSFSTTNASGSTSQAANLAEAVEAGASALLIDEDTSATNFMIRDDRMRRLIPAEREPITPFVERIRPLYEERGVSTVLVAGGSGAFFEVADHVIALHEYVPADVTAQAHAIAEESLAARGEGSARGEGGEPSAETAVGGAAAGAEANAGARTGTETGSQAGARVFAEAVSRVPAAGGLGRAEDEGGPERGGGRGGQGGRGKGGRGGSGGRGPKPARARGLGEIQYGAETIELSAVTQLVDRSQTEAIARALDVLARELDGRTSIAEALDALERRLDEEGLDWLSPHRGHPGRLARPRRHELLAAVGRFRGLHLVG
ncbi:ABC-ATPase domain-containing protein [Brevibacterium album]|uniref:ABC-ATPase domain-containing protein n=1 Tax=Brevibacterium album TaxID=417948 RepID=UPI00041EF346|nr:ABC-ATPase domain-containing protein [Brevibacterium album]